MKLEFCSPTQRYQTERGPHELQGDEVAPWIAWIAWDQFPKDRWFLRGEVPIIPVLGEAASGGLERFQRVEAGGFMFFLAFRDAINRLKFTVKMGEFIIDQSHMPSRAGWES